jgi:hypothetical protein
LLEGVGAICVEPGCDEAPSAASALMALKSQTLPGAEKSERSNRARERAAYVEPDYTITFQPTPSS